VAAVVHFRLEGQVDLDVAPPTGDRAAFRRGDVEVTLEKKVEPPGYLSGECLIVARTSRESPDEVYRILTERLEPDPEPVLKPGSGGRGRVLSEREGRWLFHPPESVVRFCDDVGGELHTEAARLVQLLRWVFDRPWPAKPLGRPQLSWSLDGSDWRPAPDRPDEVPLLGGGDVALGEDEIEFIARIWEAGEVAEPLARQILLEAIELSDDNPRAALVLAVAAAEVGVKQFAAEESPRESEAWLIAKIASPPLRRLLKDYLPFFTDKATQDGSAVPKHLRRALDDAVEARNDVVHQGGTGYSVGLLGPVLVAVNDLLYLLDWFAGNDWAFGYLQQETQQEYKT
jgi:hypothetical protein